MVPFVQFTKREKHPWRSVTFSKVLVKLYKWYQIAQRITYVDCPFMKFIYSVIQCSTITHPY